MSGTDVSASNSSSAATGAIKFGNNYAGMSPLTMIILGVVGLAAVGGFLFVWFRKKGGR